MDFYKLTGDVPPWGYCALSSNVLKQRVPNTCVGRGTFGYHGETGPLMENSSDLEPTSTQLLTSTDIPSPLLDQSFHSGSNQSNTFRSFSSTFSQPVPLFATCPSLSRSPSILLGKGSKIQTRSGQRNKSISPRNTEQISLMMI